MADSSSKTRPRKEPEGTDLAARLVQLQRKIAAYVVSQNLITSCRCISFTYQPACTAKQNRVQGLIDLNYHPRPNQQNYPKRNPQPKRNSPATQRKTNFLAICLPLQRLGCMIQEQTLQFLGVHKNATRNRHLTWTLIHLRKVFWLVLHIDLSPRPPDACMIPSATLQYDLPF